MQARVVSLLGLALAASLTSAVACSTSSGSSSGGGGGGGGGDDTSDAGVATGEGGSGADAVDRCANAICDQMARCSPAYLAYDYGDKAGCLASVRPGCEAELSAPNTGADTSTLIACADARDAYRCDGSPFRIPEACKAKGSGADGAACFDGDQCKSGSCAYLNATSSTTCGACETPGGEGASCGASAICQDGLVCASTGSGSAMACAKPGGIGASCDPTHPCGNDPLAYCVGGKCVKPSGEGATCGSATDPPCDPYQLVTCNTQTKKCVKATLAQVGDSCAAAGTFCAAGGFCSNGTCAARAKDGASCDAKNAPCVVGDICKSGTCVPYAHGCD